MNILLTGGSGFIGKSFYSRYKNKYNIAAPTPEELDLTKIREVTDYFKAHRFDAVIHCAGKAEGGLDAVVEADNLIMFNNLQYASIINGIKKLLIAGDVAEFDRRQPIVDVQESDFGKSIPSDAYGLGRYLINLLASKDKISTNLRFFNVYGAGSYADANLITAIAAKGVLNKDIELPYDRNISVIYIDDAVKIMAEFVDNDYPKGDYNIVSDKKTSLSEIANIVKRAAKRDAKTIKVSVGSVLAPEWTASNLKLTELMPKLKFTSVNTGVNKLYEFLDAHKSMCRKRRTK